MSKPNLKEVLKEIEKSLNDKSNIQTFIPNQVIGWNIKYNNDKLYIKFKTLFYPLDEEIEKGVQVIRRSSFSMTLNKTYVSYFLGCLYVDLEQQNRIINDEMGILYNATSMYIVSIRNNLNMFIASVCPIKYYIRNICAIHGKEDIMKFYEELKKECGDI